MTTPRDSHDGTAPRFAVLAAASLLHDTEALRAMVESYVSALQAIGGETRDLGATRPDAPLVVLVATGGTEREILERARFDASEPALLVAHPGHNSLPAAVEVLARVQQLGLRGEICYLQAPEDRAGLDRLAAAVHDRSVRRAMRASRIGLVGQPSDWLVASSPSGETVQAVWGPTVVPLPMEPLLAEPGPEVAARGEAMAREVRARASEVVEPAEADLIAAGHVHAQLADLVSTERLDAVAVRCFDLVVQRETTGCLALAQLNDDGVVAGCEGDLVATVAMLWLKLMTGATPWMANPARVDAERGILALAHCTVPRSLVRSYRLRSHFESRLGVAVEGELPVGPVTLVRLGGVLMEQLHVVEGELLRATSHPDLCRTQVEVEIGRSAVQELLTHPLGNHMVLVAGRHGDALARWHRTFVAGQPLASSASGLTSAEGATAQAW